MEELEREVAKRLELVQQKVSNQLVKCRHDIDTLIKIIQNLYCNKSLDLSGLSFETINTEDILPRNEILCLEGNGSNTLPVSYYNYFNGIYFNFLCFFFFISELQ